MSCTKGETITHGGTHNHKSQIMQNSTFTFSVQGQPKTFDVELALSTPSSNDLMDFGAWTTDVKVGDFYFSQFHTANHTHLVRVTWAGQRVSLESNADFAQAAHQAVLALLA